MDFLTLCYHISILDFVQMFFTQRGILTALADDDDDDLETPTQHFLCFSPGLISSASAAQLSAGRSQLSQSKSKSESKSKFKSQKSKVLGVTLFCCATTHPQKLFSATRHSIELKYKLI